MDRLDWDTAGRTVYGEGRGEPFEGQIAIAYSIKNRLNAKSWYGNTIYGVCRKPWQYSCWNRDDPNFSTIQTVTTDNPSFLRALCIFGLVMSGDLIDPTNGATHYHTKQITPTWTASPRMKFLKEIGNHRFYVERLS